MPVHVLKFSFAEVPEGETKAEVKVIENPVEPSWHRYHRRLLSCLTIGSLFLGWRGYARWKAGTLFKWNKPRVFTRRYRLKNPSTPSSNNQPPPSNTNK
jgi:hypothetical protein